MKYFKPNHTVGSRLIESPEPIGSEENMLRKKYENAKLMQKDKIGQIFSPLNKAVTKALHNKISKVK